MGGSILTSATVTANTNAGGVVVSAANANRATIILRNIGTATIFIGGIGSVLNIANGMPLEPGTSADGDTLGLPVTAEIRAIVAAGSEELRVLEATD